MAMPTARPPPLMVPLARLGRPLPDLSRPPPVATCSTISALSAASVVDCFNTKAHPRQEGRCLRLDGNNGGGSVTSPALSDQERQTYMLQLKAAALLAENGMKRSLDLDGAATTKTPKRSRPQEMALRLLISSRSAGSVIGKGGNNINRLREQNSATISIPDTIGPERVVNISADRATTLKVVHELLTGLDDVPGKDPDSTDGEVRILVHTSQAGSIIGRSGFKIKELREDTAAQIRVYTQPCPQSSDRVTQISGARQAVLQCLERILTLLDENPPKGLVNPYDPNHYDELLAAEYGGFMDTRGRAAGTSAGRPVVGSMATVSRGFPAGAALVATRAGFGGGVSAGGLGGIGYGLPGQFSASMASTLPTGGVDFAGSLEAAAQQQTQQFSIPKGAAGAIIGKGGARIRKIRQDSQAQITIDDSKTGQMERIVTITGTPDQVQMAHFLLQKCVRENSNGAY